MESGDGGDSHKDYYKILEIDYDATDEDIRLSYRRLALKWHPDKHKGDPDVTARFQLINEAYKVLSDPDKRVDYDLSGIYEINRYSLRVLSLSLSMIHHSLTFLSLLSLGISIQIPRHDPHLQRAGHQFHPQTETTRAVESVDRPPNFFSNEKSRLFLSLLFVKKRSVIKKVARAG